MTSTLLRLLKPSPEAVRELALRETDPARVREFEPITLGPLINGAILVVIALAGALTLLPRVALHLIRKR